MKISFVHTIGPAEVKSGHLNLTDKHRKTYGKEFPPHKTMFVVIDQNKRKSKAEMHHKTQIWGMLKDWYQSNNVKAGDTVQVSFDPQERVDGLHVLHLELLDPAGGTQQKKQVNDQIGGSFAPLKTELISTPMAVDIADPELPQRHFVQTYRILRDTALGRSLKQLHSYECQLCGTTIELPNGDRYAEVHHIRPLGSPHNGSDTLDNMIVVCPNHHAMCDLGAISLAKKDIHLAHDHNLSDESIEYHNTKISRVMDREAKKH